MEGVKKGRRGSADGTMGPKRALDAIASPPSSARAFIITPRFQTLLPTPLLPFRYRSDAPTSHHLPRQRGMGGKERKTLPGRDKGPHSQPPIKAAFLPIEGHKRGCETKKTAATFGGRCKMCKSAVGKQGARATT